MVSFNASKNQCHSLSKRQDLQNNHIIFFGGGGNTELTPFTLNIFSLFLFRNFKWELHISSISGYVLYQFLSSSNLLPIYKSLVRPCMENALLELVIPHTTFLYTVKSKGLHINSPSLTDTLMSY